MQSPIDEDDTSLRLVSLFNQSHTCVETFQYVRIIERGSNIPEEKPITFLVFVLNEDE